MIDGNKTIYSKHSILFPPAEVPVFLPWMILMPT